MSSTVSLVFIIVMAIMHSCSLLSNKPHSKQFSHFVCCRRYDALDGFLPEAAEHMTRLVARHAGAGPQHRFAARLLLDIAVQCMVRSCVAQFCSRFWV